MSTMSSCNNFSRYSYYKISIC